MAPPLAPTLARWLPGGLSRPLWLAGVALALLLAGVVIVLQAMQQHRLLADQYEQSLVLARTVVAMHRDNLGLRSTDASPLSADPPRAQALAELRTRQSRLAQLDLTPDERLLLNDLAGLLAQLGSASAADSAALAARVDTVLDQLLQAVTQRTERAAAAASRFTATARLALLAAVAVMLCIALVLGVQAARSVAASARMMGELDQLVHEDGLTGTTNRRGLDERLPVELARAGRSGQPLTVAMLDLDHFKRYNDRRGHGAGDALLRGAAQGWRKQLRPTDLLARYGGEEFTLVLPACDADQALLLIERLRPLVPDRQTFSAGVATWNGGDSAEELIRSADLALLAAKKGGRNRSVVAGREVQSSLPLRIA
jgi:diguanylate cyclase (GGDEF)-like protein